MITICFPFSAIKHVQNCHEGGPRINFYNIQTLASAPLSTFREAQTETPKITAISEREAKQAIIVNKMPD